jgi:hypothetical protein
MGFEVFLQCFGETTHSGISRSAVRSLFPVVDEESELDYWLVRYDERDRCHIGASPLSSNPEFLSGFYVERPCADARFWEALLSVLRMGSVVIYWPGGPPVVADGGDASRLPQDMTDSIGSPRSVSSADELLRLIRQ